MPKKRKATIFIYCTWEEFKPDSSNKSGHCLMSSSPNFPVIVHQQPFVCKCLWTKSRLSLKYIKFKIHPNQWWNNKTKTKKLSLEFMASANNTQCGTVSFSVKKKYPSAMIYSAISTPWIFSFQFHDLKSFNP